MEALLVETGEPANYSEAACHEEWKKAMDKEIESIEQNKTWELGKILSGCYWLMLQTMAREFITWMSNQHSYMGNWRKKSMYLNLRAIR